MPTNVTPYNIPVPDGTDPVNLAGSSGDLAAMATAVGTALDDKQPYEYFRPYFVSGYNYTTWAAVVASTMTQDRLTSLPFWVPTATTFDRISLHVVTAAGGSTIRLGIYGDLGTRPEPSALVLDAGTIDSSATGTKEITISQSLSRGLYWLAAVAQGGTPQIHVVTSNGMILPGLGAIAQPSVITNTGLFSNFTRTSVSGALPDPYGPTGITNAAPRVFMRAA